MAELTFLQKLTEVRDLQVTDPKTGKTGNLLTDAEYEKFKKDQGSKKAKKSEKAEAYVEALHELKRNYDTLDASGKRLISEKELIAQKNSLIKKYNKNGIAGAVIKFPIRHPFLSIGLAGLTFLGTALLPGSPKGGSNGGSMDGIKSRKSIGMTIDYASDFEKRIANYPKEIRLAIDRLRVGSENLLKGIGGIGVKNGDDNQTAQEKKKARKEAITEELVTSVDNVMKQKYPDTKKWSEDVNKLQWITMQVSAYYDRGVDPNRKVDRGSGDVIDNTAVQKTVYNMMNDVLSWYDNPNGMSPWGQKLGQVTEDFIKTKGSTAKDPNASNIPQEKQVTANAKMIAELKARTSTNQDVRFAAVAKIKGNGKG